MARKSGSKKRTPETQQTQSGDIPPAESGAQEREMQDYEAPRPLPEDPTWED